MEQTSVFTKYLQMMTDYSAKTDAEKITKVDYMELQRMSSGIKVAYQKGDLPPREYKIISNLYECVKDAVRNYTAKNARK